MSMQNRVQEVLGVPELTQLADGQINVEDLLVYIETERAGRAAAQLHPQVQSALASSAACRQAYEALKAFLQWEASAVLETPPRPLQLDLSYLPVATPAPVVVQPATVLAQLSWYWAQLGYLVVELSSEILGPLQSLQPQPTYSFARAAQGEANAYHFTLENQLADLNFRLTIEREQPAGDQCQVIVEAEIPSRGGWPNLADTIVNLKQADTVVQSRLTDAFGRAVFPAVALSQLPALQVEVIPGLPPADPDHRSG